MIIKKLTKTIVICCLTILAFSCGGNKQDNLDLDLISVELVKTEINKLLLTYKIRVNSIQIKKQREFKQRNQSLIR